MCELNEGRNACKPLVLPAYRLTQGCVFLNRIVPSGANNGRNIPLGLMIPAAETDLSAFICFSDLPLGPADSVGGMLHFFYRCSGLGIIRIRKIVFGLVMHGLDI